MNHHVSENEAGHTIVDGLDSAIQDLVKNALARHISFDVLGSILMHRLIAAVRLELRIGACEFPRPQIPLSPGSNGEVIDGSLNARKIPSLEERLVRYWRDHFLDRETGWPPRLRFRGPRRSLETLIERVTRGETTLNSVLDSLVAKGIVRTVDEEWVELICLGWESSLIEARVKRLGRLSEHIDRLVGEILEDGEALRLQTELLEAMEVVTSHKLFESLSGDKPFSPDTEERAVSRWASEAKLRSGRPIRLKIRGSHGSFQQLIERETRDVTQRVIIAPLIARGVMKVVDDEWVELLDPDWELPVTGLQIKRVLN